MARHNSRMRNVMLFSILVVSLIVDVVPVSAAKPKHTLDDALLLMIGSHNYSFEEGEDMGWQPGSRGLMSTVVLVPDPASAPVNEAQRLMTMYQEICAETHRTATKEQLAVDKCVTEKVLTNVCGSAIQRLKKQAEQLARQRRRRRNPLRRFFRRLDPSRINLKRFGRWLSDEVLKEAVLQMVTGGVALKGKLVRGILRKVFWRKVRREVRLSLARSLMRSGARPNILIALGLPEAANVTVSRSVVVTPVDFDAFVEQCQREEEQEDTSNSFFDDVEAEPDIAAPAKGTTPDEPQTGEAGEVVRSIEVTECDTRNYFWDDLLLPNEDSHFSYHEGTGAEDVGEIAFTLGFDAQGRLADGQMSFTFIDDVWDDAGTQQLSYVESWVGADFSKQPLEPTDTDGESYWNYQGAVDVAFQVEGWAQCSYIPDPENPAHVFYNVEAAKTETHAIPFELAVELLPSGEMSYAVDLYGGSQDSEGFTEIYLHVSCAGTAPLESSE